MSWFNNEREIKTSMSKEDILEAMQENNMFDMRYQRARYLAQKENGDENVSTIEGRCCHTIFKHLIHVFMISIVVSFGAMIYYIQNSNSEIHIDDNFEQEIEFMKGYMNNHPQFYGISKLISPD